MQGHVSTCHFDVTRQNANNHVAVGTPVTRCPPHRSVREELPHTAPTLSTWRQSFGSLTHSSQSVRREDPAWYPVHGFLLRVPLGRCPFLDRLRRDRRPIVRRRLRYYGTVRLLGIGRGPRARPMTCAGFGFMLLFPVGRGY